MAIDIIARGLAASIVGPDGKISSSKMPTLEGTSNLEGFTSIGKLTDPSLVEGKTAEEILLMMLYGVVNPALLDPSFEIVMSSESAQLIIGRESLLKGSLIFSRGKIDPAFGTSGYRAGEPTHYTLNGELIESSATSHDFSITVTPTNNLVEIQASVSYAEGEQPVNSANQAVSAPLPAGTLSATLELDAYYPLYTADGEEHPFEWFEDEAGKGYFSAFASEAEGDRQAFGVSSTSTVIGVKSYNTLTQRWEWLGSQTAAISLTYFDISVVEGDTNYILYTHNSTPVGARELRIYVE